MMVAHTRKTQSFEERMIRQHHSDVRELKSWCYDHKVNWYNFTTAPSDSICVLSRNEYDLHEKRVSLEEDSESYFLDQEAYELWCDGEDY